MSAVDAPRIEIVVVNYRTAALTIDCLASLAAEAAAMPDLRVSIVDNDSGDGSAEAIAGAIDTRGWRRWAALVRAPVNGGFAYGNNIALRAALARPSPPELFWLLNPDTRVMPGAAQALAEFCARYPRAGIVGSALVEEDGAPWPFAFRFHTATSEFERGAALGPVSRLLADHAVLRLMSDEPTEVDWVSGASMVVRREVVETIGMLDESYFLYYEETDFCLRARRAGWACWYMPEAIVLHLAGQSTGLTGARAQQRRVPGYWFASRRRYFEKNHGRAYTAAADLVWLMGYMLGAIRRVWSGGEGGPPKLVADFLRHSALLPGRSVRLG